MTKFNPKNKNKLTYAESLGPAMNITNEEDAIQYLRDYIKFIQDYLDNEPNKDNMTAEEIAKSNLGYYAGYYGADVRERVERLFMCYHPIFGKISEHGSPTFNKGVSFANRCVRKDKIKYLNKKSNEF